MLRSVCSSTACDLTNATRLVCNHVNKTKSPTKVKEKYKVYSLHKKTQYMATTPVYHAVKYYSCVLVSCSMH